MKNKPDVLMATIGVVALLIGVLIYLIERPDSYVSKFIFIFIPNVFFSTQNYFVKYYFADYLWAMSLSCFWHMLLVRTIKESFICTVIVSIFGIIYEGLQFFNVIIGTGDILDVFLYLLACISVNLIYLIRRVFK